MSSRWTSTASCSSSRSTKSLRSCLPTVYPPQNPHLRSCLIVNIQLTGVPTEGFDQSNKKSLADAYDYVMHGRVYKYDEDKAAKKVYGACVFCVRFTKRAGLQVGLCLVRRPAHAAQGRGGLPQVDRAGKDPLPSHATDMITGFFFFFFCYVSRFFPPPVAMLNMNVVDQGRARSDTTGRDWWRWARSAQNPHVFLFLGFIWVLVTW